jgi:hypothetical protein
MERRTKNTKVTKGVVKMICDACLEEREPYFKGYNLCPECAEGMDKSSQKEKEELVHFDFEDMRTAVKKYKSSEKD